MLKFINFFLLTFILLIKPVFADDIAVTSVEARQWAYDKGQQLLLTLAETDPATKFAKLDKMMLEDVNLDYIGRFVIGKYARKMTPQQKEQYNSLFRRYALSLYKQINLNFDASAVKFTIDFVTEFPKYAVVGCTVDPSDLFKKNHIKIDKVPAKFKLIRGEGNRIQAVDVEISEVSMVIEYRKRFYQMIHSEGDNMEWFLEKFEDKVKANEEAILKRQSL